MNKLLDYTFGLQKERAFTDAAMSRLDIRAGSRLDGWEQNSIAAFAVHGFRGKDGRRAIDRFANAVGASLSPMEIEAMEAVSNAWPTLIEIEEVHVGEGFDARDLVFDEQLHIHEVSATYQLRRWDLHFGWLFHIGGRTELTGAGFHVPRMHRDAVARSFLGELSVAEIRWPGLSRKVVAGEAAWGPQVALRRAVRETPLPQLRNFDGEEILFCEARYSAGNPAEIKRTLASHPFLQEEENGFTWIERRKRDDVLGDYGILGHVMFDAGEMVITTNSRERLAKMKDLLVPLKAVIGEPLTERIEHPKVKLAESNSEPAQDLEEFADRLPPAHRSRIIGKQLTKYYSGWLDMPLPALKGKTPRQAVRSKAGRSLVEELLKDIENATLRMGEGDTVDFDALRRQLGLRVE